MQGRHGHLRREQKQLAESLRITGGGSRALALIDLGLAGPAAQGLGIDPELLTDSAEHRTTVAFFCLVHRQPDRAFAKLVRVLPRC